MPTYLEVQTRINSDHLNRTDLSAETKRCVQAAIRHYERKRFWWNQTSTATTAVSGTAVIALPTDFLILDNIQIQVSGAQYTLLERSFEEILDYNSNRPTGQPTDFALRGTNLWTFPIANQNYSATLHYVHKLSAVSADSDTNKWLSAAEDLVVYHATKLMWANVLRNGEEAGKMAQLEVAAFQEITSAMAQRKRLAIRATRF